MEKQTEIVVALPQKTTKQDNSNQPKPDEDKKSREPSDYGKEMRQRLAERKKKFYTKK